MRAVVLWIGGVVAAGLVRDEALGWLAVLERHLVTVAARRLPPEFRDRYQEEWNAELGAVAGGRITRLVWTLSLVAGSDRVAGSLAGCTVGRWAALKPLVDRAAGVLLTAMMSPMAGMLVAASVLTGNRKPIKRVTFEGRYGELVTGHEFHLTGRLGRTARRYDLDLLPVCCLLILGQVSLVGTPLRYATGPGAEPRTASPIRPGIYCPQDAPTEAEYLAGWSVRADLKVLKDVTQLILGLNGRN